MLNSEPQTDFDPARLYTSGGGNVPSHRTRACRRGAGEGGNRGRRTALPVPPARVQRRHAPARLHRHGPRPRTGTADRRRADHGPGRHRPGPDPRRDEPVSALDVTTQARVVALLGELQRELGLALVFIAHDLAVVRQVSDRVAAMRRGRLVEHGPADEVYDSPREAYTRQLLAAVPALDPESAARRRAARSEPAVA